MEAPAPHREEQLGDTGAPGDGHRHDRGPAAQGRSRAATTRGATACRPRSTAAAPATNTSDGKRVDATHVPLVTAPLTRGCRSSTTSRNASSAGARRGGEQQDAEAPPALLPTTSTTTTTTGTATAATCVEREHATRGPTRAAELRPGRGRSSAPCSTPSSPRRTARAAATSAPQSTKPQDVAGMTEVALARRRDVEVESCGGPRSRAARRKEWSWSRRPIPATVATTRNSKHRAGEQTAVAEDLEQAGAARRPSVRRRPRRAASSPRGGTQSRPRRGSARFDERAHGCGARPRR